MLGDSTYFGCGSCSLRENVLIRIFVLSSIGHMDDHARNIHRLWRALGRAQISLIVATRGQRVCGQTPR
jgi:hypothetical protein